MPLAQQEMLLEVRNLYKPVMASKDTTQQLDSSVPYARRVNPPADRAPE